MTFVAEQAGGAGRGDRHAHPAGRERILPAHVEIPALAPGREARDRHPLDHRERIALHQDAVLERAGLRLVGVADHVVGPGRRFRHGLPLAARRKRRPAAAHELGGQDLANDPLRADLDRPSQRGVSARSCDRRRGSRGRSGRFCRAGGASGRRTVVWIDGAIRNRRDRRLLRRPRGHDVRGGRRGERDRARRLARVQDQRGRSLFAAAQARASFPAAFALRPERMLQLGAETLRPLDPTGDVVADVGDGQGSRREREEVVERDDAVRLGGRHGQAPADIVEGARRDPAKPRLDGMERGQEEVAAGSGRVAAQQATYGPPLPRSAAPPAQAEVGGPRTESTAARSAAVGSGPWK